MKVRDLAKMIDHSLLHPTITDADLRSGCEIAAKYACATVCIKPYAVLLAAELLAEADCDICAVAGFPHGNSHTSIIVAEAELACEEGASEIDIVANTGKVLGGNWDYITAELKAVNEAMIAKGAILKVIFENDFLEEYHIINLSRICSDLNIAFIKTSTGYGFVKQDNGMYSYEGSTVPHLMLMREHSDSSVQIKAAGGVKNLDGLLRVRELGCTRVGATATIEILEEAKVRFGSEY